MGEPTPKNTPRRRLNSPLPLKEDYKRTLLTGVEKIEEGPHPSGHIRRVYGIVLLLALVAVGSIRPTPTALLLATLPNSLGQLQRSSDRPNNCPLAVRNALGVYKDPQKGEAFPQVVLLTAANWGYLDLLQNWQALADRLGLKYAVLAMDERIHNELGPALSVPTNLSWAVSDNVNFGTLNFIKLNSNKLRSVFLVMETCQVDVVYADADCVFLKDPMDHDLGKMIKSKQFQYIYQSRVMLENKPRSDPCLTEGKLPKGGNAGFFYASHSSGTVKRIFELAIEMCEDSSNAHLNDQVAFWRAVHLVSSVDHCTGQDVDRGSTEPSSNSSATFCCMDPYYYLPGNAKNPSQDAVTYHATRVVGKAKKIKLLKNINVGVPAWSDSRLDKSKMNESL